MAGRAMTAAACAVPAGAEAGPRVQVAAAADAALDATSGWGLDGRRVAIEGFGKVGGGVAREVTRRGARVVAVSTVAGCISDQSGLDVELLLALRRVHGDACVARYGRPVEPPDHLFGAVAAVTVRRSLHSSLTCLR